MEPGDLGDDMGNEARAKYPRGSVKPGDSGTGSSRELRPSTKAVDGVD